MTGYRIIFLLFLFTCFTFAQQVEYEKTIGSFKNALSFFISASGQIYVTDSGNDELISLDTLGNHINSTGGYGWVESAFDEPVDVFSNTLSVYVTDKNNHRIQRFDRNLNFISSVSTRESDNQNVRFGYPLGCSVSNQGDLYVLDSENQRVIKFDLFGNFILNLGGFDAGNYQLINPKSLAVGPNNLIYVLDDSGILIFDSFGNGIGLIETEEDILSIRIVFNNLTINTSKKVFLQNLDTDTRSFSEIDLTEQINSRIISSIFYNEKLYILTPKEIDIYSLVQ